MGENISNDISSESTHEIASQKSCILLGMVSIKVVQRIVKFEIFGFFHFFFFFFSLTWDHMGVKFSNDISSESTHQICSQKIHGYSWGGSRKWLMVERHGPKFQPQRYVFSTCRVLIIVKCSRSVFGVIQCISSFALQISFKFCLLLPNVTIWVQSVQVPGLPVFSPLSLFLGLFHYIALAVNLSWFHLRKGQVEGQGPWASCLFYYLNFTVISHAAFV